MAIWLTALATVALAAVTGVLAAAAWRALDQLRIAVDQLEEVKRDRHVEVLDEMGRRWESHEMTEALIAKAGSLESSLVAETFGGVAKDEWSLWRPAIKALQQSDPLAYVEFERMAEEAD